VAGGERQFPASVEIENLTPLSQYAFMECIDNCSLSYINFERRQTAESLHQSNSSQQSITLRCIIPVVCVTNEREENMAEQHN